VQRGRPEGRKNGEVELQWFGAASPEERAGLGRRRKGGGELKLAKGVRNNSTFRAMPERQGGGGRWQRGCESWTAFSGQYHREAKQRIGG